MKKPRKETPLRLRRVERRLLRAYAAIKSTKLKRNLVSLIVRISGQGGPR